MEVTFESILQQLLEEYEKDQTRDINEFLAEKLKEMGVSEECMAEVEETSAVLDGFSEKYDSLMEAREAGVSRAKWFMNQIDNSLDGLSEQTKTDVLNGINVALENQDKEISEEISNLEE